MSLDPPGKFSNQQEGQSKLFFQSEEAEFFALFSVLVNKGHPQERVWVFVFGFDTQEIQCVKIFKQGKMNTRGQARFSGKVNQPKQVTKPKDTLWARNAGSAFATQIETSHLALACGISNKMGISCLFVCREKCVFFANAVQKAQGEEHFFSGVTTSHHDGK